MARTQRCPSLPLMASTLHRGRRTTRMTEKAIRAALWRHNLCIMHASLIPAFPLVLFLPLSVYPLALAKEQKEHDMCTICNLPSIHTKPHPSTEEETIINPKRTEKLGRHSSSSSLLHCYYLSTNLSCWQALYVSAVQYRGGGSCSHSLGGSRALLQ